MFVHASAFLGLAGKLFHKPKGPLWFSLGKELSLHSQCSHRRRGIVMAVNTVGHSALVVDDDVLVRTIHKRLLEREGWLVKTVVNGHEAVELFHLGEHFDLVLMDKEMPILDGVNATSELRAMGVQCHIVGVTSCADALEVESFIGAGLDAYYSKPLNHVKLGRIIQHFHEEDEEDSDNDYAQDNKNK